MALTANWILLGEFYYRKCDLYQYHWSLLSDASQFIGATYGGPIALLHPIPNASRPTIYISTCAGEQIGCIKWNSGNLLALDWSVRQELVCVQADANILLYDLHGNFIRSISAGKDASDVGVIDGKVFTTSFGTTGVVVMTNNYRFYMINNIHEAKVRQMADLPGIQQQPPSCWCVINQPTSCHLMVARQQELCYIDVTGVRDKMKPPLSTPASSFIDSTVSLDNKYLALYTTSGIIWLGTSDLKTTFWEFDTENSTKPTSIAWCGNKAVVVVWNDYVMLIGVNKEVARFDYDSRVFLVSEVDGLRLICESCHQLLQIIPEDLLHVFRFGSETSGALLFEAYRLFNEGKKDAHEYMKMIGGGLREGVVSCIRASGHEFDAAVQKELLKAALFGRSFIRVDDLGDEMMRACNKLKVLNAVRGVGIPLTVDQLDSLTIQVTVNRLMYRHLYWLAFEIMSYLKIPENIGIHHVLNRWACHRIETEQDEEALWRSIGSKLQQYKNASFSTIIYHAIAHNKKNFALNLIDQDPHTFSQVPLFLKLNMESRALEKALLCGDSDLVYLVLLQWKDKLQQAEFLRAIRLFPAAFALHKQHCRQQNREMLIEIHHQEDEHVEEAVCRILCSYEEEKFDRRLSQLLSAKEAFEKAKNEVFTKLTEDQIKLLRLQKRWEDEGMGALMDLSIIDTLCRLLSKEDQPICTKAIEVIKKEFKISDKQFWWCKIQTLAEQGEWEKLEKFSKSKKSPIGYEPFIDACVKAGNKEEAGKYLSKLPSEQLVRSALKIGDMEKAVSYALQSGKEVDLEAVRIKCQNRDLLEKLMSGKKN